MTNRFAGARRLSFMMLAALAACSSLPPNPRDVLDESTGATVTIVGAPITFSGEPDTESAHDYLTLVAVRTDEAGRFTELLLLYRWSGYLRPAPGSTGKSAGELLIEIDGRTLELQPLQRLPAGLPKPKDLFVPDATEGDLTAYVTDVETMRLIATSRELSARVPQEAGSAPFKLWRDGRPALAQFVKQLSGH